MLARPSLPIARIRIAGVAVAVFAILALLVSTPPVAGQALPTAPESTEATPPPPPPPTPEPWESSARAAMQTFLESFDPEKRPEDLEPLESAARVLDLSEVPSQVRDSRGPDLAAELKLVLDRTELIDLASLPDSADGEPWKLEVAEGLRIEIAPDELGRWSFTPKTLRSLPEMLRATEDREIVEGAVRSEPLPLPLRLRAAMPRALLGVGFLLEHWQWLGLLLLSILAVVLDRIVTFVVQRILERELGKRLDHVDPGELHDALRPTGLLAAALLWWVGVFWFALPSEILQVLVVAARFVAISAFVWAAYRLVDILAAVLEARATRTDNKYDDLLVPLVRKSLKIFIAAFGLVFIADNLNVEISSLLAGLGIGGIALALAAQDTVRNLFGSLTVIIDQPFHVGDWVKIGDVEGTVAEVGFRSTRIRTFYDSLITLPNAHLISASVDNLGARSYRRWSTKLSLAYDTPPDRVEAFCEGVRELIAVHPWTRKDSYHVYLNELGAHSIDVLLYMFFDTPDWATELRERHRLALDILRIGREVGVEFAFPTQTLYLRREDLEASDPRRATEGYDEVVREARASGRDAARRLVDGALGGVKPPPVGTEQRGEAG